MTVTLTTACNLSCPYCFQNTGPAVGSSPAPRIASRTMTPSRLSLAADFTAQRAAAHDAESFAITLFGGEPFLRPDLCTATLDAFSRHLPVSASTITNGTHLTPDTLEALIPRGLKSIQLSLDGGRRSHDSTRFTSGGRPTYDIIMQNLRDVGGITDIAWVVRLNVTQASVETLPAAIDDIARIQWSTPPTVCLDIIHDAGIFDETISWGRTALDACLAGYRAALDKGLHIPEPAWHPPCPACAEKDSVTGTVIDADGDIVSCWESIGRKDLVIGSIDGRREPEPVRSRRWRRCGFSASDAAAHQAIRDELDIEVLELLRERDLLGCSSAHGVMAHS